MLWVDDAAGHFFELVSPSEMDTEYGRIRRDVRLPEAFDREKHTTLRMYILHNQPMRFPPHLAEPVSIKASLLRVLAVVVGIDGSRMTVMEAPQHSTRQRAEAVNRHTDAKVGDWLEKVLPHVRTSAAIKV
eukprot:6176802-Pleurochrysis_carterae.AAC.4